MATVAQTGSSYGGNVTSAGNIAVTVPGDADCCIVQMSGYAGVRAGGAGLASVLAFDGAGMDFALIGNGNFATNEPETSAWILTAASPNWPGAGAKNLSQSCPSYEEGIQYLVTFWKSVDQSSPLVDVETEDDSFPGATWTSAALTGVGVDDMTLTGVDGFSDAWDMDPTGSGQTALRESAIVNSCFLGSAAKQGAATMTATGGSLLAAVTFALRAATATGVTGTGAVLLPVLQVSSSGKRGHPGTGAVLLPALQVAGSGKRGHPGTGAITFPALQVAGSGTAASETTGAGAVTLPVLQVSGSGARGHPGSGAVTLPVLAVAGSGTVGRSGAGAVLLPTLQVGGAGVVGRKGTGAVTFGALAVAGSGAAASGVIGAGAVTLPALIVSGTGVRQVKATGNITLPALVVAGQAARSIAGTGAITLPALRVSGFDASGIAQYINGTAFDSTGRMVTVYLDPEEPLPAGAKLIEGVAHSEDGRRYVTVWVDGAKLLAGYATRQDGVWVITPDVDPDTAVEGIGVTTRHEVVVTQSVPSTAVAGFGLDGAARLCVTNKS